LFFSFFSELVLLAPSPSKYSHFNCSNILVNMYLQLWLLSYAYQQRGREGEHSRGGGLRSWGHAWHNADLLLEVCSCNIHSRFGCCPPIPDVLYARASWQCNSILCFVLFLFWHLFFSVLLVSKQFWVFYVYFLQELSMFPPVFVAKYWYSLVWDFWTPHRKWNDKWVEIITSFVLLYTVVVCRL
jgi:hypothetical protein